MANWLSSVPPTTVLAIYKAVVSLLITGVFPIDISPSHPVTAIGNSPTTKLLPIAAVPILAWLVSGSVNSFNFLLFSFDPSYLGFFQGVWSTNASSNSAVKSLFSKLLVTTVFVPGNVWGAWGVKGASGVYGIFYKLKVLDYINLKSI